jgi:hypothetical protein
LQSYQVRAVSFPQIQIGLQRLGQARASGELPLKDCLLDCYAQCSKKQNEQRWRENIKIIPQVLVVFEELFALREVLDSYFLALRPLKAALDWFMKRSFTESPRATILASCFSISPIRTLISS